MESPPQELINPYAPPKAAADGVDAINLDQNGYRFKKLLVANRSFRSPLICAKLGIPISPESKYKPQEIRLTSIPRISKKITNTAIILATLLFIYATSETNREDLQSITFLILVFFANLQRLTSKPYKIPFHFSQKYKWLRIRRTVVFILFTFLFIIGAAYFYHEDSIAGLLCLLGIVINASVFHVRMTTFHLKKSKGGYHYIRGVHRNLLDTLPPLPLSTKS